MPMTARPKDALMDCPTTEEPREELTEEPTEEPREEPTEEPRELRWAHPTDALRAMRSGKTKGGRLDSLMDSRRVRMKGYSMGSR